MYPELSFCEINTSAFIEDYLKQYGTGFRKGVAGNGIIGRIDGEREGDKVIAVRAEMDALPVTEQNTAVYKSTIPGQMHACGHDANMAALLCVARILEKNRDKFGGTVLLIFQPGEEKTPGGAKLMIDSGELYNPKPDIILAQHVLPELETGMVGYKAGLYMASSDEIYITLTGKGGHAALTGLTTDQIFIASKLIIRLKEKIAEKQAENKIPTVFATGRIIADGATNVIPEKVEIAGTFRTFNEAWREEAHAIIRSIAEETASEYGIYSEVTIEKGYPVLYNDETLTEKAIQLSSDLLGKENIEIFTDLRMSSDDFSFYPALAPCLYLRYGIKEKGKEMKKLHTPGFDIDENALYTGITNMCWLVLNFLSGDSGDIEENSE
jgi:amidohydrolase